MDRGIQPLFPSLCSIPPFRVFRAACKRSLPKRYWQQWLQSSGNPIIPGAGGRCCRMGASSADCVRGFASSTKASVDFVSLGNGWAIRWCSRLMDGAVGSTRTRNRWLGSSLRPERKRTNVSLDQVPDRRSGKRNRLHLDLYTSDQEREVERLIKLGARLYPWKYQPDDDFIKLLDPDGNDFCVVQKSGIED
jgi:hypothetical protein